MGGKGPHEWAKSRRRPSFWGLQHALAGARPADLVRLRLRAVMGHVALGKTQASVPSAGLGGMMRQAVQQQFFTMACGAVSPPPDGSP